MVFKIRGNRACVRAFLSRRQFHCKRESQHDVNGCVKCVADCIIRRVVPQPTERQRVRGVRLLKVGDLSTRIRSYPTHSFRDWMIPIVLPSWRDFLKLSVAKRIRIWRRTALLARFFVSSGPATTINQRGKEGRHESTDSVQKHNNSANAHRTDACVLCAFAASASAATSATGRHLRSRQYG